MAWSHGFFRFAGRGGSAALLAAVGAVLLGGCSAQDSCVQVSNTSFVPACPCDAGSTLSFSIEGQTTITAITVNVAIVLDGSGSIFPADFLLSKDFAKNTVAAFADENLFDNGGTASFTQFSSFATLGGTFSSQGDFDAFVDAEGQLSGGTDIPSGIARGSELLAAAPTASASFMVVLTDGVGGDPTVVADAARAAGTIVYAVGVGLGPDYDTLLAIAGDEDNIFYVDDFTELDTALEGIISNIEGSVPCAATGATISLVFDAAVAEASVGDGSGTSTISADGSTVIFELSGTLEATPTEFSVVLEVCEGAPGDEVVSAVTYTDDEGNVPDLSALEGNYATVPTCPTPAPVSPTPKPLGVPVPAPVYKTCDNGFDGIQAGSVCCMSCCGSCGGNGCAGRPGGADACCKTAIKSDGKKCSVAGAAPCYIDDDKDKSTSYSYGFAPSSWDDDV